MSTAINSNRAEMQDKRAMLARRLQAAAAKPKEAPLSFAQQRLWFLDQLEPNSPLYNIASLARLTGPLNIEALEKAVNALVARHEVLRTRFVSRDGTPLQVIEPAVTLKLSRLDLGVMRPEQARTEWQRFIHQEVHRPFNLGEDVLVRVSLLQSGPEEHLLLLVMHHIVGDEWSLRVLFKELALCYEAFSQGKTAALPPLRLQYADYAAWKREWLQGKNLQDQLHYWKQQLAGADAPTELATDYPRRTQPSFAGAIARRKLDAALKTGLAELARRSDASLFMVLLAGFQALVARYTRLDHVTIATPIAGRNRVETEDLIGFFVNTLPLRVRVDDNPSFEELLRRTREAALGAYAHQDLPFERLVEELQPERSLRHMPFTNLVFVYQNALAEQSAWGGVKVEFVEVESELAKFELTLTVQETASGLNASLEYNRDLFAPATVDRLLEHLENLLTGAIQAPAAPLSALPLLSEAEKRQLLVEFNETAASYPRDKAVHQIFEAVALRTPDAPAVVFGHRPLTYGELNARANQLAHYLKRFHVGHEVPVAICVERSLEMVIGLLAILKAGAAYVPLDPAYPRERLAFMLKDIQSPVLLTQQPLLAAMPPDIPAAVCLDTDWELIGREERQNPHGEATGESLAYIMYTSGSTGRPKGVAVPHRAISRLVLNTNYIRLGPDDRIAQVSNISFDAATFEIWGSLLNGGQLVGITRDVALSPADFAQELRDRGITAIFLTAALFNQLASEAPGALRTLRTAMAGGEALDPKWVRSVLKHGPPERLVNGYGPTENTTFTCCYHIARLKDDATNVPIGRPIANTQVHILDPHLNPVPIGVHGEIYTGGDGLARGYWQSPDLTAEKFVPNPFCAGTLLYRTGDLARYLPDGTIEFLGRIDDQVKIRGFRIELGEVESNLGKHPDVQKCVVTATLNGNGIKKLVAYVVPHPGRTPGAAELRRFLAETLPDYMVPAAFVTLAALPITPNGKVDRKALPAPDHARPELEQGYLAPRDPVESQLASVWEQVLNVHPIGLEDNFFELGGHSLLAVKLVARIEKTFGKKVRVSTVFQAPTVAALAAILRNEVSEREVGASSLVRIQPQGSRPPLFLVHGAGGGMFWGYANLARHLGSDQPVYAFKSRGMSGEEELPSVEEMARSYVEDMRRVQPRGPYYLGGYCFGGVVAYELARQLRAQGESVAFLGLLNCAPPNSRYTRIPWTISWAGRFLKNLVYWLNYFRQWSRPQKREFLRWKWYVLRKRLSLFSSGPGDEFKQVNPGDLVDLSSFNQEEQELWCAHISALLKFRPQPYDSQVHLFRSPGHPLWCSFDHDYGWSELVRDNIHVSLVPGAHEKILEEPCVEALAATFSATLQEVQAAQAKRASASPVPAPTQDPELFRLWNGKRVEFPVDRTYPAHLAQQVRERPGAVALRWNGEDMTFAELDAKANQLARRLLSLGVGPEVLVGVCLPRSSQMFVAMLAIWKAGGAYLPLDPGYPAERLQYMVQDSRTGVLLSESSLAHLFTSAPKRVLRLDDPDECGRLAALPASEPPNGATADSLAYVIYTSGSTGMPKGVEITHRALLNHNFALAQAFQLRPGERVLQFTPTSFDVSVEEVFPSWLSGCAVVIRGESLLEHMHFLRWLEAEKVNILNLPTAFWHDLVEYLSSSGAVLPPSVRLVIVGGEKVSDAAFRRWKQVAPASVVLMNGYGATEATVTSTLCAAQKDSDSLPIGRPIANTQVAVLDGQMRPVAPGVAGELFIGGAGLGRGYLGRPELTRSRFVPNPFPAEISSEKLYRTGDLARFRPDGNLEFIGRADDQVKIRGYRIELGEVEAVLRAHPAVADAVVAAREDTPGKARLVGYYTPRGTSVEAAELAAFLGQKLPAYMVPAVLVALEALPLTPAGKLDRAALPAPPESTPGADFIPPRNPLERELARIWMEVLGVERVGMHDKFFDLGGHSLLAIRAISRIRDRLKTEISIGDFFALGTVEKLAAHLSRKSILHGSILPPMAGSNRATPLSFKQRRIWFLDQFDPRQSPYNLPVAVRLEGTLDLEALQKSMAFVAGRHPALRAIFPAEAGEPVQYISNSSDFTVPCIDLSGLPQPERQARLSQFLLDESRRAHIRSSPVLRTSLARMSPLEHWLVLVMHELTVDSWSLRIAWEELLDAYGCFLEGRQPALPALPVNYPDVGDGMAALPEEQVEAELRYWREQLKGAPELLELPTDRLRPVHRSDDGSRCPLHLKPGLLEQLREVAANHQSTPEALILACFGALFHRYTGSEDVVLGTITSTRRRPEQDGLVGNFENYVALRFDCSGDPVFLEFLARVTATLEKVKANGRLAFARLLDALQPKRNASYTPVFQVAVVVHEDPGLHAATAGGLTFEPLFFDNRTARFDLEIHLFCTSKGLSGWLQYSTDLFDAPRIQRMLEHFSTLLESIIAAPQRKLSRLSMLSPQECSLLAEWNRTERPYPAHQTIWELFEEQVSRTPTATALICGTVRLTYQELWARAAVVADQLEGLRLRPESLVGICAERNWEMVAGMLGTLKAGCAYVPLDPAYPKERLAFIVGDAAVPVILTQRKLVASLPAGNAQPLCLDELAWQSPPPRATGQASPGCGDRLAYVIYTSGSTGKPKGVALEHRSAVALISWASEVFTPEELSGVVAATSICFDLSVFEIFVPLCCGGRVILAANALALPSLPAAAEASLVNTVPSAMRELLRVKGIPPSVRTINLAGEPLAPELVDQIYAQTSARKVYDLYGPTETTVYSTYALRLPHAPATIGRPLANEQVFVLDKNLQPVAIGIPGNLYIGGAGLARGYLNREDLTAQKFVPHPFAAGQRLYATGDLARWRDDGQLEYLGRSDHQVKIRGFRIELGEVEAALKRQPGVKETIVVARQDSGTDKRLVGYVVMYPGKQLKPELMRQGLLQQLPDYMLPSALVELQALPLTANGKIDRQALPAPEAYRPRNSVPPRNAVEQQLAGIWREVLHVSEVGVEDSFFDMGGNSLLAIRVIARIGELFKVELPLFTVFDAPTIAQLAAGLSDGRWTKGARAGLPLQPLPRGGKLPASFVQERLWFLDQLAPGSHAYNVPAAVRLSGSIDTSALRKALDAVVQRHETLRTSFEETGGILHQVVHPKVQVPLEERQATMGKAREADAEIQRWLASFAQAPFSLGTGPLIRAALLHLDSADHVLAVAMHHTVSDGWSLSLFFKELAAFYEAFTNEQPAPSLPPLPIQYADFAHWQRQTMQGAVLQREQDYWRQKLAGAPPQIDLPADVTEPPQAPGKAERIRRTLEPGVCQHILAFGHQKGATLFMLLMNALSITLFRWTGQADLVLGTVVAGRNRKKLEDVIGCFMNFLPVRIKLQEAETADEALARLRKTLLEAQNHQECPFEKIVEAVNPHRTLNQNPLYNVALLLQNYPAELFASGELKAQPVPVPMQDALLDLRFEVEERGGSVEFSCEYRTDLFQPSTAEGLLTSFIDVLTLVAGESSRSVGAIPISDALPAPQRNPNITAEKSPIVVAANFTAEPVGESLSYWLDELDLPFEVKFAPYNQVFQQLVDPASLLRRNTSGLNLILLRLEDWDFQLSRRAPRKPSSLAVGGAARPAASSAALERNLSEFKAALSASAGAVPCLVCICPSSARVAQNRELSARLAAAERQLASELSAMDNVHVLTGEQLNSVYPVADYYDVNGDELGHVPFTPKFFTALGTAAARKIHALKRPPHKVIVLDCDHTLWTGVCGEEGPHGIRLEPWRKALQEFMVAQHRAGMLLCLCSKNNEADVREVFANRPDMLLKPEHFVASRLNWVAKSENLKSLAQELKLGLDSFIFIDDNPVECAEVEANCPQALTLQLPENPSQIPSFLRHCWVFDHLKLTDEDRRRTALYQQNRQREQLRAKSVTLAEFLAGLELRIDIQPVRDEQLSRAAQLTQRTNQFNCTSRRRSEAELRQLLPDHQVHAVTVSDRFGDYGLVGVMICTRKEAALEVDSFLLSCRVLGRGVEHRMLAYLGQYARQVGAEWVDLHFLESARNQPALDFLQSVGASFQQPLNGGMLFRFPVGYATELKFTPPMVSAPALAANGKAGASAALGRKFTRCRSIALEADTIEKIHRRVEARVTVRRGSQAKYAAPHTELERRLAALWSQLLRVERVGIDDDFFELGGHSLLAVRLFSEIQRLTGRKLPLVTLFQAPTIRQLANQLGQDPGGRSSSLLVPIQTRGEKPPLFLVHGAGGDVLWGYANLAAHLPPDQPVYGIKSRAQAGREEAKGLEEMAAGYVEAIRELQPRGPYRLGGYCFGGNVAYEMARQLQVEGEEVSFLGLMDATPANAGYETLTWWEPSFPLRFARNAGYWLRDFYALSLAERRSLVARKVRAFARKLKRKLRPGPAPAVFDLEEVIEPGKFPENELKLWQVHLQALNEHVDGPWAGHVHLYRTRGQALFCSLAPDFCWGRLAGGVTVHYVPGAHESIFMEPHVRWLAELLTEGLAEAQGRAGIRRTQEIQL